MFSIYRGSPLLSNNLFFVTNNTCVNVDHYPLYMVPLFHGTLYPYYPPIQDSPFLGTPIVYWCDVILILYTFDSIHNYVRWSI